jgi:Protein of unknown function (DUF541)
MKLFAISGVALTLALGIPRTAACIDGPPSAAISGQGAFELKKQPDILRIHVDVQAKGKTVKEALTKLQERKQSAQTNLQVLGAIAETIRFGEPMIVTENPNQQRQMMMIMRQRAMMGGKQPDKKPKEPPPIVVTCTLAAEVPLKAASPEDLLITSHELEKRVRTMDLGGAKDMKQASAQDEELAQENDDMDPNETFRRGDPLFLYVRRIAPDEELKAMTTAFQRARTNALKLAKASGSELGALQRVDDSQGAPWQWQQDMDENITMRSPWGSYQSMNIMGILRPHPSGDEIPVVEAVGTNPSKVVFRVGLSASFELLKRPNLKP